MQSTSTAIVRTTGQRAVLWTHYEWRCERAADGFLRLYHHADSYAAERVYDQLKTVELAQKWFIEVQRLNLRPEELVGAGI